MKIGILTFHCADNYGAVLQTYALQRVIQSIGNSSEIIDYQPSCLLDPYSSKIGIITTLKESGFSKKSIRRIVSRCIHYSSIKKRKRNFEDFRIKYLLVSSKVYHNYDELLINPPVFDAYIVGSDQVWNPDFVQETGRSYFLSFAPDKSKKISYAASISNHSLKNMDDLYHQELIEFNQISVREDSAKVLLSELVKKQIEVTLDPTLLLEATDWETISSPIKYEYKYLLVYDLIKNDEILELANLIAKRLDLKIISYTNKKGYDKWAGSFGGSHPSEFISLFMNAQFIITNSFHGTAFSIIFKKEFFTIPHPTRGDRMINLLDSLNLSDRLITCQTGLPELDLKSINYSEVSNQLKEKRKESIKFLKEAVNN